MRTDHDVRAFRTARKLVEQRPDDACAATLSDLVGALEADSGFQLSRLYELGADDFDLAMRVLGDWRLDRHYAGRAALSTRESP